MMMRRRGRPLMRAAATTAVVAGTAGAVRHHQETKYANQAAQQQAEYEQAYQQGAAEAAPAPVAAAPAAPASTGIDMDQLKQLGISTPRASSPTRSSQRRRRSCWADPGSRPPSRMRRATHTALREIDLHENPPILISVLGFFGAMAGFAWLFFGLRLLGFDWFGALGDVPAFEQRRPLGLARDRRWHRVAARLVRPVVPAALGLDVRDDRRGLRAVRRPALDDPVRGQRHRPRHDDPARHHHHLPAHRRGEGSVRHRGAGPQPDPRPARPADRTYIEAHPRGCASIDSGDLSRADPAPRAASWSGPRTVSEWSRSAEHGRGGAPPGAGETTQATREREYDPSVAVAAEHEPEQDDEADQQRHPEHDDRDVGEPGERRQRGWSRIVIAIAVPMSCPTTMMPPVAWRPMPLDPADRLVERPACRPRRSACRG